MLLKCQKDRITKSWSQKDENDTEFWTNMWIGKWLVGKLVLAKLYLGKLTYVFFFFFSSTFLFCVCFFHFLLSSFLFPYLYLLIFLQRYNFNNKVKNGSYLLNNEVLIVIKGGHIWTLRCMTMHSNHSILLQIQQACSIQYLTLGANIEVTVIWACPYCHQA